MAEPPARAYPRLRGRARQAVIGSLTGIVGGMGAFMHTRAGLVPAALDGWSGPVVIVLAGVYTYLLLPDLRGSVAAMLLAFGVGIATLVLAWIAPLWLLPYPPAARDLLLPGLLQRAVTSALSVYLLLFLGGYLTTLLVAGYFDW